MKNILTLFTSNADFIVQCRIACKLTIENANTGWWLKQTLDRLEKAEAEITKLKADVELMPTVCFLNEQLRKDVESLNDMLRRTGYGQGQIDAYAAQCEEIDRLKAENELLRLGWCRESEKRQQDWFDPSKGPTCDRERFI